MVIQATGEWGYILKLTQGGGGEGGSGEEEKGEDEGEKEESEESEESEEEEETGKVGRGTGREEREGEPRQHVCAVCVDLVDSFRRDAMHAYACPQHASTLASCKHAHTVVRGNPHQEAKP